MKDKFYVLVACEESQAVTQGILELNERLDLPIEVEAYSCDILPSSGGMKDRHFKTDVFEIISNKGGVSGPGSPINVPRWDMMIAHPPCTYQQ